MSKLQITLRAARVNRGLTLVEVASIVGKGKDLINRYEKDSTDIPRDLMVKLLKLYGVTHDDIFFGVESDFIETNAAKISFPKVVEQRHKNRVVL